MPLNPELFAAGEKTGFVSVNDVNELRKALTAGYGTDISALTGGAALRIQSLDQTMQATIAENRHFRLFNALAKRTATATVDEWTEQSGVGGFLGGTTNTETGTINEFTGTYTRRYGLVRYLMTLRKVSLVQSLQNNIVDAEAAEAANGAKQLLMDAEFLLFEGNSDVVPTEFDGIYKQLVDLSSTDHVLDAEGQSLNSVNLVNQAAATIAGLDNFGTPTDLYLSPLTQADFDTNLDPAFRVPLTDVGKGGVELGAPVAGIRTSWGDIKTNPDIFLRDEAKQKPFETYHSSIAVANVAYKPASVTTAVASDAASKFATAHAGNYYYAVAGCGASGQSAVTLSSVQAVAAGEKCTLTITAAAGGETGFVIYRSRKGGTNNVDDFRECARIAKADAATTTWVDYNREMPGTSKAYVLNLSPTDHAISWQQFLPMFKFPLAAVNQAVIPWAQLLFGYLRITKRRQLVVIKNILPANATWKPFV